MSYSGINIKGDEGEFSPQGLLGAPETDVSRGNPSVGNITC